MAATPQNWIDMAALEPTEARWARFQELAEEGPDLITYADDALYGEAAEAQARVLREMGIGV